MKIVEYQIYNSDENYNVQKYHYAVSKYLKRYTGSKMVAHIVIKEYSHKISVTIIDV